MAEKKKYHDDNEWLQKASQPLRIVIVGAGIGGLTTAIGLRKTGHQITILEQAANLSEVGAGIQIAPNAARVFSRFGLLEEMLPNTILLDGNSIRRYNDGQELCRTPFLPTSDDDQSPIGVIHRGDLLGVLLRAAHDLGIEIRTSSRIVKLDETFNSRVQLESGEWISGDVVLAADGIKSVIRAQMGLQRGFTDDVLDTKDSAYRILLPRDRIVNNDRLRQLLDEKIGVRWVGPGGHVMAYPLQPKPTDNGAEENTTYNLVAIRLWKDVEPTVSGTKSRATTTGKQDMLRLYSGWAPIVQELMACATEDELVNWPLDYHPALSTWVKGRIALLGDAAHPMLPYVAQGMANAVEDAGVLTEVFANTNDVELGLRVYQHVRKQRSEEIQQSALRTQRALHLPDGPEQVARDRVMQDAMQGGSNPDAWSDRSWQMFVWGTDVVKTVREQWTQLAKDVAVQSNGVSA